MTIPGWASDEMIEDLRKAGFAAADKETQRRDLAEKIQRRAFEIGLYLPIGQFIARAFRNSLSGILDSPIPVLWNTEKG
jgi:peptide/nickel transport system substrate-binding protein